MHPTLERLQPDPVAEAMAQSGDWNSLEWRLDHLYKVTDKDGKLVQFVMNDDQRRFIRNIWTRNIILKARQRGFSTLMQVLALDHALFNKFANCVVIADTLPNAGKLFGKVELAFKQLPDAIKAAFPVKAQTSRSLIEFEHGSTISVSTSSRGGTVQLLHVSELGKISRKYPQRAAEIVSGAFESVSMDSIIVVESTAEGAAGEFWDLCEPAIKRWESGEAETALDWRLFFSSWFSDPAYRLSDEDTAVVAISNDKKKYFDGLEATLSVKIDRNQRAWYIKKEETQKRKMKAEYPSTPYEAFEQAIEGAVFGDEMTSIRETGRITTVPLDVNYPVNTFWDFGLGRRNPIWLHQRIGLQNRWVKYFDDFGKGLGWWWRTLEDWRREHGEFQWGTHYLPHDADTEILGESVTTKRRILVAAGMRNEFVVPRVAIKSTGIDLMRSALPTDNWFDRVECAEGIKCLDGYQYEWNEKMGIWSRTPLGNWASHGADAWMQYAQGFRGSGDMGAVKVFKTRKKSWR